MKPRLTVGGGLWVCTSDDRLAIGVGVTPMSAYKSWKRDTARMADYMAYMPATKRKLYARLGH